MKRTYKFSRGVEIRISNVDKYNRAYSGVVQVLLGPRWKIGILTSESVGRFEC